MDPRLISNVAQWLAAALATTLLAVALAGCGKSSSTQPAPIPPLRAVVLLTPDHDTLAIRQRVQMVAVGVDSATGDTLRGLGFDWSSSNRGVATVTTNGLVTAQSPGNALIVVSGGGQADTAFVTVLPDSAGWIVVGNTQATEVLHGVFFLPDGRTGWAVGNGGTVLSSADGGRSWTRQNPTSFDLQAVFFSGGTGFAVGTGGTILESVNYGTDWTRLTVPETGAFALHDVAMIDAFHIWVVGDGGTLIGSADGGAHWSKVTTSTLNALNGIAFSGQDGWAVGDGGVVFGTHDGGASWYRVSPAEISTASRLMGVARQPQPTGVGASGAVAVGAGGTVLIAATTADSLAWILGNAGANYELNAVALPAGQTAFAAGSNLGTGTILRSDDGGRSWFRQTPQAGVPLNDVWFVDALRGWAVGNGGVIRRTVTGGTL